MNKDMLENDKLIITAHTWKVFEESGVDMGMFAVARPIITAKDVKKGQLI